MRINIKNSVKQDFDKKSEGAAKRFRFAALFYIFRVKKIYKTRELLKLVFVLQNMTLPLGYLFGIIKSFGCKILKGRRN